MRIAKVTVSHSNIQLKSPYALSFTTLKSFKSNIIKLQLESGKMGLGEVTALPGYGTETFEKINIVLERAQADLEGANQSQARAIVNKLHTGYPFSAAAIGTALDLAFNQVEIAKRMEVPLLKVISSTVEASELENEVSAAYGHGYRTIKVKIGKDVSGDIEMATTLLSLPTDVVYRFDANQGYNFKDAILFVEKLEDLGLKKVQLLEQPFQREDWHIMMELCNRTSVPLGLDESIYNNEDIKKASEIGCSLIKLKLCKSKGINHLLDLAGYAAEELGLKVILGNGVSTDIGNLAEAVAFTTRDGLFYGAFEGNGFLKLERMILGESLRERGGYLVFELPPADSNGEWTHPYISKL